MSPVPHIRRARPSRQTQPLLKQLRLSAALALGLTALFCLATLGVSAQLGNQTGEVLTTAAAQSSQPPAKRGSTVAEFVPGDILVCYRSESAANREEAATTSLLRNGRAMAITVERFDGSRLVSGLRLARVRPEDTLDAIASLNDDPEVLYAEPNYILHKAVLPNDARFGEIWALKNTGQEGNVGPPNNNRFINGTVGVDIDAETAWTSYTTGSSSVVVGIIDTGIDINHPDLQANIWTNPGESGGGKETNGIDDDGNGRIDDVHGWDFFSNNNSVFDSPTIDDHGTHVAGTIGAVGNNGIGVTGINWQVKMMPLKFLGTATGSGSAAGAIAAINYAVDMRNRGVNIRVLNNSWGGSTPSNALTSAVNSANAAGILFVVAAGNETTDRDDTPEAPSNIDASNVIRVAATDRIDDLVFFSNFGSRLPSIGAPGRGILSTTPRNYPSATYTESDGSTYSFFSGTSMAAPQVSGVAALILAQYPAITMQRLRTALLYSGEPIPSLTGKTSTGRRLNAKLALDNAGTNDATPPTVSGLGVAAQNGRNVTLQFAAGDDGSAGLAALYDVYFTSSAGGQYHLGAFAPSALSDSQSVTVEIPARQTAGTVTLKATDEVGNNASAGVGVAVSAAAAEPYSVTLSPAVPLSTGGTAFSFNGDDKYAFDYPLPFSFPFFGKTMNTVTVSTNGALYFLPPPQRANGDADDAGSSLEGLNSQRMIAGMWDDFDLRTCFRPDADLYVVQPDAGRVIFRWQGVTFSSSNCPAAPGGDAVNFEIELRSDGTIQTRYGAGNSALRSVVGISQGEADSYTSNAANAYVVNSHTSTAANINLPNAQTVTFTPQATSCSYSISATSQSFSAGSAASAVNVTAGAGCGWTAASNDPSFITITSGAGGTGNGTVNFSVAANTGAARTGTLNIAGQTFTVTQAAAQTSVQLGQSSYVVSEGQGFANIVVTRTGDTSTAMAIRYATSDTTDANFRCDPNTAGQPTGIASRKCDYHIAAGKLRFAPGETTKQLTLSIVNDVFVEGPETFTLSLNELTLTIFGQNISVPLSISVPVTITDNDSQPAVTNPIDQTGFFVRQLYVDLLSREPDPAGLSGWTTRIDQCGQPGQPPPPCDRVTVGGDGFLRSGEFFDRQFFVLRLYRAGLGRILRYDEIADLAFVSGFLTETDLELNKQDLVADIMARAEFANRYNGLTNDLFVDTLLQTAGVTVPADVRQAWITALNNSTLTRAQVYRQISERAEVSNKYLHEAQVVSAYYGFFTRNPDGAYLSFLDRLDRGEINLGDLANAFINAQEYRQRFGP
jgi:subtilisin family serine protease